MHSFSFKENFFHMKLCLTNFKSLYFLCSKTDITFIQSLTPIQISFYTGTSLYEENVSSSIFIEKKEYIKVKDVSEGMHITFILYYCLGYAYPLKIAKTMEFLQRYFLFIVSENCSVRVHYPRKDKISQDIPFF